MPIKKTRIRSQTSRILAETIIGPKKQPIPAEPDHNLDAPSKSPARD